MMSRNGRGESKVSAATSAAPTPSCPNATTTCQRRRATCQYAASPTVTPLRDPPPWGSLATPSCGVDSGVVSETRPNQPSFAGWMGSMWLYTVLRFGLFFALWGILELLGVHGFLAPILALVLSVPLSLVLLARPRAMFTRQLEARIEARKQARDAFDARLEPDETDD